ncbi:MAG: DUF512 domain-containing protein [Eubacteriales bacterium]|nr:DUF512 domain-containing protein [Eubacteriales bacterium]
MKHRITQVDRGSIAQELGLREGDLLTAINGEIVRDLIDYQALCAQSRLTLTVERDGETTDFSFEKDEYEPLGLNFAKDLMSGLRCCANKCIFCFEDQNPPGVRPTLSSRDDDWRLSLMTGSFVTLTNVPDRELQRIIDRRVSPLYISVHATDGELRAKMMGNAKAARIMEQLRRLAEAGIRFHAQAAVCPGLNDAEQLEKTIHDLAALAPAALSLAVVPVGITCHRQGLFPLRLFTKEEAKRTLEICRRWRAICRQHMGSAFVHPADELFLIAGEELPADEDYEGYDQIENGVGMLRLLETEYAQAYDDAKEYDELPHAEQIQTEVCIATGVAAADFLREMLAKRPVPGVQVRVQAVPNRFFGETVNVAGLLTGRDLLDEETGVAHAPEGEVWITECMLREGEEIFLDDMTAGELAQRLGKRVRIVRRGGEELFMALCEAAQRLK